MSWFDEYEVVVFVLLVVCFFGLFYLCARANLIVVNSHSEQDVLSLDVQAARFCQSQNTWLKEHYWHGVNQIVTCTNNQGMLVQYEFATKAVGMTDYVLSDLPLSNVTGVSK